ncbi:hypothetical protein, partial [Ruegeria sp. HKCCD8929]|uniref:hypothetical protein n=1 Tax=Ruegeria sp. HKCCD8929 TaxID=2683006 RepID=UPI001C2C53E8
SMSVFASPAGGPIYSPSEPRAGGRPALVWPDTVNDYGLELPADASCSEIFIVMQYKDGIDEAWDNYITLITDKAGITSNGVRTVGNYNGTNLYAGGSSAISWLRKDGGSATRTLLPMPLSVIRFTSKDQSTPGTPINIASLGGPNKGGANRAWQGIMCQLIAVSAQVTWTEAQAAQMTDFLMQKWGIS